MNGTNTVALSKTMECPSLVDSGLSLSSTNVTAGTVVHVQCSKSGHRPSNNVLVIACLNNGDWMPHVPSCEWSWNFNIHERVVFGTLFTAALFFVIVSVVIIIAYNCSYKKRLAANNELYHKRRMKSETGYKVHNLKTASCAVTYLANQELGYIPRPMVIVDRAHK